MTAAGDGHERVEGILARLPALHPKLIDLSLDRMHRLLDDLGHPERRLPPVIHVAGTNGKGSTVAFLRAMLEAAGLRVHVYTSPHLVRFNERVRLGRPGGGTIIDDAAFAELLKRCETLNADRPISFFEITTAAAFLAFSEHPADVVLLEVGLGGRLDATNVVERPALTVVTPVSFDHPEFLGETVEKIAAEKAGILKRGVPAIFAAQDEAALAVLVRQAERLGVPFSVGDQDFATREEHGRLIYEDERGLLDLPLPRLAGRHQHGNAGTAIAALRRFRPDVPAEAIAAGILGVSWPARLQRLVRGVVPDHAPIEAEIWLDGGHNAEGGRVLAEAMGEREDRQSRPLVLICGMLTTKDPRAFLENFADLTQELIAVPVGDGHSGRDAAEIAGAALSVGIPAASCGTVMEALAFVSARPWPVPPRILITGSLYLAGDVLKLNGTPPT
ncbi:bifunctional folylpolyglutamate synthase/dihydrofolate synthase [Lichenihabitans sp. Uapishka_5]|uniref:bifunctional folylpolyglutamate synthase/dihydrofolate synthase n=1 Tax=Lichenihabitans sp. Uapishka_5 TaxID=3037302 RepID=UPI0029E7DF06|nr:folylpolyglutamate synthase/dihydrofolate synthase family protein [Lichenihabitans sp. Uapishka_5]MDX7949797.1 bifunctional folylpolyglutamate synthase/dihydrofolate synthase [Lichenihabitans sp. Uapishka_5]